MPAGGLFGDAIDLLAAGGWVLVVLAVVSVVGLAIVLLKLWQFRAARIGSRSFIEPVLENFRAGHVEAAKARLATEANPIARLLELVVAPPQGLDRTRLVDELERIARQELAGLRRYLRALEAIATLSPLLGLLGTVLGMIDAFRELQLGTGQADPALLAGGISKALLTTAGGLVVAIPASAALNGFEGAVDSLHDAMEDAVTRALHVRPPAGPASVATADAPAPKI